MYFVVYTPLSDSSGYCSDTAYADITVRNCACDSLHAHIAFSDTSFCVGATMQVILSGGAYGQLTTDTNGTSAILPISAFQPYVPLSLSPSDVGTHYIRFVVYSANPDSADSYCSDTAYAHPQVNNCGCDTLHAAITFSILRSASVHLSLFILQRPICTIDY